MSKEMRCGDLMEGCHFVVTGDTEEEVLQKAAEHAKATHGITEINDDLMAKVRGAIHEA